MKKQRLSLILILTALFAAFTAGLFVGRNHVKGTVTVSVPAAMQTLPPETQAAPATDPEETQTVTFPININTASAEEFSALPGIGEVLAQRILTYREEHGSFDCIEGLMNVEGIGEKRMEDILDLITIGG